MYCCVHIWLTQYTIEHIHPSFKISFLSRDVVLILRCRPVTVLDSDDALLTSVVKHRGSCSMAVILESHWINVGLCPAHQKLSISGGICRKGVASAGPDAELPSDDWMVFLRDWEKQRLMYEHPPTIFLLLLFFFISNYRELTNPLSNFVFAKMTSI